MSLDIRPPLDAALDSFGLDATVTPGVGPVVATTAFWLPPVTVDVPLGGDFHRAELRRVLVLPIADLGGEPARGDVVAVSDYKGGPTLNYKIDSTERYDWDHVRCIVVPVTP